MSPVDAEGCVALGNSELGYLLYAQSESVSIPVETGKYDIFTIDTRTGDITSHKVTTKLQQQYNNSDARPNRVYWLKKH